MEFLNSEIFLKTIRSVVPSEYQRVSLHEPTFSGNEWEYVKECIDSGWVSSVGKYVDLFEKMLCDFTGVKKAVAVVNGTAALQVCLRIAGVEFGDEVLIPDLTFIATANAVTHAGAIPHIVDVSEKTLGLDPYKLDDYLKEIVITKNGQSYNRYTNKRIAAVVPMHTFGHTVDLDPLLELCEKFNIVLVEDAAESLGSYYKGVHTGNHGRVAALSFNGNKIVTTGGGGAILTNDEKLGTLAKHLTTTAKIPHAWEFKHDFIGYNYRLPNLNAALGCAQLENLPTFLERKRNLAEKYYVAFKKINGLEFFKEPDFSKSNYWLNTVLLDNDKKELKNELLKQTNESGFMTRPSWELISNLSIYSHAPRMTDLSCSHSLAERILNIPSSPFLDGK